MYGFAYKLTFLSEQVARRRLRKSSFSLLTVNQNGFSESLYGKHLIHLLIEVF